MRFFGAAPKSLGRFDRLVTSYFDANSASPFVEELTLDFLNLLEADTDPVVRAVSACERALLMVRSGSSIRFEVLWDRNPDLVFRALADGEDIPTEEPGHLYRLMINTSRNQANGSTLLRLHEAIKLLRTAAVLLHYRCRRTSSCLLPARCPDWLVCWRRCRFSDRHLRESVSAPPIDSAHNALRRPPGFWAEHPISAPQILMRPLQQPRRNALAQGQSLLP